jgi:hypothetical protein
MKKILFYLLIGLTAVGYLWSCEGNTFSFYGVSIDSFVINGVYGQIKEDRTILIKLPLSTNVKALVPTIALLNEKDCKVSPASGVAQDFTNPVEYKVTAPNGDSKTYVVTVELVKAESGISVSSFSFPGIYSYLQYKTIDNEHRTIHIKIPTYDSFNEKVVDITSLEALIDFEPKSAQITPSSSSTLDFTNPIQYTIIDAEKKDTAIYTVTVTQYPFDRSIIISFAVNVAAATVSIDYSKKTVSIKLLYGTDVTALTPTIELPYGATVSPASGAVHDFTNPVEYLVTAEDGKSTSTYVATVSYKAFPVAITNVSKTTLDPGESFTITGTFADNNNKVELVAGINTYELEKISENADAITVTAPITAAEGNYSLWVTSNGANTYISQAITIIVPTPEIALVRPLQAIANEQVTITGTGFLPVGNVIGILKNGTTVYANLVPSAESNTSITFQLPSNIDFGKYTVKVGTKTAEGGTIIVVDAAKARIIALNRTIIRKGIDNLIITGQNMKEAGKDTQFSLLKMSGVGTGNKYAPVNEEGTEVTINANVLEDYKAEKYQLHIGIEGSNNWSSRDAPIIEIVEP